MLKLLSKIFKIVAIILLSLSIKENNTKKEEEKPVIKENIKKEIKNKKVEEKKKAVKVKEKVKTKRKEVKEIATLEIDKLNLKKKIYAKDNKMNTINKGIEALYLIMPDQKRSLIALVGHSGFGFNTPFDKLDKLKLDDQAKIIYKNKAYHYQLKEKFLKSKKKIISFKKEDDALLYLITCDKKEKDKFLILKFKLLT